MKHIHLIIPDELGEQLRQYAHKKKIKQTPVIIQALDHFLNRTLVMVSAPVIVPKGEEMPIIGNPTTSPNALRIEEAPPVVQKVISKQPNSSAVIVDGQDNQLDDDGNQKTTPESKKRQCPFCKKMIWGEFAQKHYSDKHGDI